jgi:chromosomal replication initiation ATPase DnaA
MSGARRPPRQLSLELPHQAELNRADFLVGAANRQAIALIDRWPEWPDRGVFLIGPAGSGKSHLAAIWSAASGAAATSAATLRLADVEALVSAGAVAVEDLQTGPVDEAALFHLVNRAVERSVPVLLTSRLPPTSTGLRLPDLVSRLRAMHLTELVEPDDELLGRVLLKLFADRQLSVEPAVTDYIVLRLERSLEAANAVVAALDAEALAEGRAVTKRLAGTILRRFGDQIDFWPGED